MYRTDRVQQKLRRKRSRGAPKQPMVLEAKETPAIK